MEKSKSSTMAVSVHPPNFMEEYDNCKSSDDLDKLTAKWRRRWGRQGACKKQYAYPLSAIAQVYCQLFNSLSRFGVKGGLSDKEERRLMRECEGLAIGFVLTVEDIRRAATRKERP